MVMAVLLVLLHVFGGVCCIDLIIGYFKHGKYFLASLFIMDFILILFNFIKLYFAL